MSSICSARAKRRRANIPKCPTTSAPCSSTGHVATPPAGVQGKIAGTNVAAYTPDANASQEGACARDLPLQEVPAQAEIVRIEQEFLRLLCGRRVELLKRAGGGGTELHIRGPFQHRHADAGFCH
jgi:hypothetical protein